MSNEKVKSIIDSIENGQPGDIRERLGAIISEKAVDALESKKVMVARSFFGKKEE